jgi:hypothetical protein
LARPTVGALQYGGQGIGMVLIAPALWWMGGANAILAGSAIGFGLLVGACFVLSARLRHTPAAQAEVDRHAFSFRQTCRFFQGEALARDAVTALAMKALVTQGIIVALPLYLSHDIGLGKEALAFLLLPVSLTHRLPPGRRQPLGSALAMRAGIPMTAGFLRSRLIAASSLSMNTRRSRPLHFEMFITPPSRLLPVALLIGLSPARLGASPSRTALIGHRPRLRRRR